MGKEDEAELQDIADKQVQLKLGKRTPTKGGTGITLKALQGGLDKYFNVDKFASSDTNQLKFDMHLMTIITQCNQPFNFVERPGFKKFMSVVSPRVAVKSTTAFNRTKLPLVYDNMKKELATILQKNLADVNGVGFTSDGWAAKNQECFQSLTMHYIDKNFEMKRFTICGKPFSGKHSGDRLAAVISTAFREIPGLKHETLKVLTTDSASNMMKCGRVMIASGTITHALPCADHKLHNIIKGAYEKNRNVNSLMKKSAALANSIHKSS